MVTLEQHLEAKAKAVEQFRKAGFHLKPVEIDAIDTADFGLGHIEVEGAQILALLDTPSLGIRLISLFPNQTEPEHWHTAVGDKPGKEETVRVLEGTVGFYVPGEPNCAGNNIPKGKEGVYTCRHETQMGPGDQLTLPPGTKHWFQAGNEGAVLICFCSAAVDALDPFTDPHVVRVTKVV